MECAMHSDFSEQWTTDSTHRTHSSCPAQLCTVACRRASSFPIVNDQRLTNSSRLHCRWKSDSEVFSAIVENFKLFQKLPAVTTSRTISNLITNTAQESVQLAHKAVNYIDESTINDDTTGITATIETIVVSEIDDTPLMQQCSFNLAILESINDFPVEVICNTEERFELGEKTPVIDSTQNCTHQAILVEEKSTDFEEEAHCQSSTLALTDDTNTETLESTIKEVSRSSEAQMKNQKAVRFADDCGHTLFVIKEMTEPSSHPPKIDPKIIRRYRGLSEDDDSLDAKLPSTWTMTFKQPASNYAVFRKKVENSCVALENVRLKNDEFCLAGTIRVKNICPDKLVFVRITFDEWKTYTDQPAKYISSASRLNDTFGFEFEIPPDLDMVNPIIEFCVCFAVLDEKGQKSIEYWDSNDNKNYSLRSEAYVEEQESQSIHSKYTYPGTDDDAYTTERENWSSFASWKHFNLDRRYY